MKSRSRQTGLPISIGNKTGISFFLQFIPVSPGTVFMYADNTTVYSIINTVDIAIASLNKALSELNN